MKTEKYTFRLSKDFAKQFEKLHKDMKKDGKWMPKQDLSEMLMELGMHYLDIDLIPDREPKQ